MRALLQVTPDLILATFILFCRIGGCLMVMPGFGAARVPPQVRLFLAVALTFALAPILVEEIRPLVAGGGPDVMVSLIASELAIGLLIGTVARAFFAALQTLVMAATSLVGLSTMPGVALEDSEPMPPLVTFVTLSATVMMFLLDQHTLILKAIVSTYVTLPPAEGYDAQEGISWIARRTGDAFLAATQVTAPFLIYGILVNTAMGVVNKLMPQLPVFFIAQPIVMMGGLILFVATIGSLVSLFAETFGTWLAWG